MTTPTRRAVLAGTTATAAAAGAQAAPASAGGAKAAAAVLAGLRTDLSIPAVSAAAVRGGKLVWAQAQGLADVDLATPATPQNRFRIGSCSKLLTALTVIRLVERGAVDLDKPIGDYRPTLPATHRATTFRQLLGHQGGVRHYGPRDFNPKAPGGTIDQRTYRTTDEALAIFVDDKLLSAPGEAYNYSTFGFSLAAAVLESATGATFLDLVQREVAAPLSLQIVPDIVDNLTPGRVRPYQLAERYKAGNPLIVGKVINAPAVNPAYKWAGGGFLARATDLALMGGALLKPGYLKAASLETLFQPQTPKRQGRNPIVGLAWRIDTDAKGRRRFHHAGAIEGGRSAVVIYPDAGVTVALTSNLGETPNDPLKPITAIAEAFGV